MNAARPGRGGAGPARWLALAAAPTFAVMAVWTMLGGGGPGLICSAHAGSPLNGMATMYLLMSAFHAAPWLRLSPSGAARSLNPL